MVTILFPPAPHSLLGMRKEQKAAFGRRSRDRLAVCRSLYPGTSGWYWVRSTLSVLLSLLVILVGFVFFPVHNVLLDESFW